MSWWFLGHDLDLPSPEEHTELDDRWALAAAGAIAWLAPESWFDLLTDTGLGIQAVAITALTRYVRPELDWVGVQWALAGPDPEMDLRLWSAALGHDRPPEPSLARTRRAAVLVARAWSTIVDPDILPRGPIGKLRAEMIGRVGRVGRNASLRHFSDAADHTLRIADLAVRNREPRPDPSACRVGLAGPSTLRVALTTDGAWIAPDQPHQVHADDEFGTVVADLEHTRMLGDEGAIFSLHRRGWLDLARLSARLVSAHTAAAPAGDGRLRVMYRPRADGPGHAQYGKAARVAHLELAGPTDSVCPASLWPIALHLLPYRTVIANIRRCGAGPGVAPTPRSIPGPTPSTSATAPRRPSNASPSLSTSTTTLAHPRRAPLPDPPQNARGLCLVRASRRTVWTRRTRYGCGRPRSACWPAEVTGAAGVLAGLRVQAGVPRRPAAGAHLSHGWQ